MGMSTGLPSGIAMATSIPTDATTTTGLRCTVELITLVPLIIGIALTTPTTGIRMRARSCGRRRRCTATPAVRRGAKRLRLTAISISTTAISIRRAQAAVLKGMRGLRRLGGAVRQRARRRSSSAETWLRWLMGWPARRVKPGYSGGSPVRRRMPWGLSAIFGRTC